MATTAQVIKGILQEREYQTLRWGTVEARPHTVAEWLLIMRAELNEAIDAWSNVEGDQRAMEELLQATAVGVAAMQQHGVYHESTHTDFMERHMAAQGVERG